MKGPFARGLRRFVDALQRGLFDEDERTPTPRATPEPEAMPATLAPPARGVRSPEHDELLRHPRANREVVVDGRRVAFLFARSRRRSIGFLVGAEGLSVRAPKWVTLREVDAAVRERGAWIVAKLVAESERAARTQATRMVWRDGATVAYLGDGVTIVLGGPSGLAEGEAVLREGVDASADQRLLIGLPRDAAGDRIRDAVQSWLQREARRVFAERAAYFAERLGVRVTRLALSSAETRWGSANANGAVRLHWRLIHHPLATIDYVVAHELAHLREMNHSPRFWKVVESVVPDYERARRSLRDGERPAGHDA
jgi:predicted metal-dependent hydrolase